MDAQIFKVLLELREGIRTIPKNQLSAFFDNLRQQEYQRIGQLDKDQLTDLQSRVNIIGEMEFMFLQAKETKQ